MKVTPTKIQDCFILEPAIFDDGRGVFFESYNHEKFKKETNIDVNFVQDNQSISQKGVVRGLHFQKGKHAQAKLVRVIKGKVLVVIVDLRKGSKTFGKTFSIILSAENNKQLFVPRGFAHGFSVLEDTTVFAYKCDNYYNKESENGIIYNDKDLNIDWHLNEKEIILSEKDKVLSTFKEFCK
jgi:dTDP-4-dehydrorhamnose 3,5-epimerase